MNDLKVQEVFDFIDQRLIITENEDDYVLSSDIYYFLNKDKDYRDIISYRVINKAMRQIPHKVKKEKFKNSANFVGLYWRPKINNKLI
jgi:hypothetical protein